MIQYYQILLVSLHFCPFLSLHIENQNEELPLRPNWPKLFYTEGSLAVKYGGIEESFKVWVDDVEERSRFDFNDGDTIHIYNLRESRKIFSVTSESKWNEEICIVETDTEREYILPFPNNFEYVDNTYYNDIEATIWKSNYLYGGLKVDKTLITRREGEYDVPLLLESIGVAELLGGMSHDEYIFKYDIFEIRECLSKKIFTSPFDEIPCNNLSFYNQNVKNKIPDSRRNSNNNFYGKLLQHDSSYPELIELHSASKFNNFNADFDYTSRIINFITKSRYVNLHNRKNGNFFLKLNQFSDIPDANLKFMVGTSKDVEILNESYYANPQFPYIINWDENQNIPISYLEKTVAVNNMEFLPEKFDWRYFANSIPTVKSQAYCSSCWAFSTTTTFEWFSAVWRNQDFTFSEQALIDCTWEFNRGCYGGSVIYSLYWAGKYGGIPTTETYGPYLSRNGKCHHNETYIEKPLKSATASLGFFKATVEQVKAFLITFGPFSAHINADLGSFYLYDGGIYDDINCSNLPNDIDHGVVIVGYDQDINGQEYWIAQNSWSPLWGEDGYMRIAIKDNICGVRNIGATPIVY